MTRRQPQIAPISDRIIEAVRSRLAAGKRVRRTLPGGGRLHMDRPLPTCFGSGRMNWIAR